MRRKLLVSLMAGVMAFGLLTGCGGSGEESGKTDAVGEGSSANGTEEPAAEDETLSVWCWDPTYNINAMQVAERIYQKEHPNFKLEIVETDAQTINEKLATATTSDSMDILPDIILFDDSGLQRYVTSYPEVFLDLGGYDFNYEDFSQGKVGMSMVDGRTYGIPFDSGTAIACYRTDILEQAGYTIEDFTDITWSEWIEKAKVVLDKTGCPLLNGLSSYNQITIMLQSAGGSYFNDDGTANLADNEIVKKTVETYVEMVKSGVYTEETGWDTYIGGMNTGRIAGAMNGCWIMTSIQAAQDQSGLWAITNLPRLDDVEGATNYSSQGGSSWAITTNCKKPELAVDFFKNTYGGSTEFYDEILPTGAIATWLPAAASEAYATPHEFFSGQPVFSMITEYSAGIPECYAGVYFQNANADVANAITNILYSGAKIDDALQEAEETLIFEMQQ